MAIVAIPRITTPWKTMVVAMAVFGFVYGYVGTAGSAVWPCASLGQCLQYTVDRGLPGFYPEALIPGASWALLFAAVAYVLFLIVYGIRSALHGRSGDEPAATPLASIPVVSPTSPSPPPASGMPIPGQGGQAPLASAHAQSAGPDRAASPAGSPPTIALVLSCPSCGGAVVPGAAFCYSCGTRFAQPTQEAEQQWMAAPPSASLPGSGYASPSHSGFVPRANTSRAFLEAGAAGVAAVAFFQPLLTLWDTTSHASAGSLSTLGMVQYWNGMSLIWCDLIVFGTVAAVATAVARAFDPRRLSPKATLCGFLALAAGYAWVLLDWNNQFWAPQTEATGAFSTYCIFGCSMSVTLGMGLFLGLGVGVIGVVLCLVDPGEPTPTDS